MIFEEFKRIKSVIGNFECRQQYLENIDFNTDIKHSFINNLKLSLKVACISKDEYEEQVESIKQLIEEFKSYCNEDEEPIYLIDYLLDGCSRETI